MKEELIKFLENHEELFWELTGKDYEILNKSINEFFASYQPERSKREDLNDGFFSPPWNINEHPEKTEGWVAFQQAMNEDPTYYLGCGTLNIAVMQ